MSWLRALSFLVFLSLVACVEKPTMKLNHAEITSITPTLPPNLEMAVVMDVHNPNSYDVAVRAVRGQVWMADKYPLNVDFHAPPDGLWMASGKTTQLRVLLLMPLGLALQIVQEALYNPQIAYRFIGKADVTGTRTLQVEKDDYSVDERGVMTREQLMAVIPYSLVPH
jgi:hypothetical protein